MTVKITYEEWLSAVENANAPSDSALLLSEWSQKLMLSRDKTREWIRTGLDMGWMRRAPIVRVRLNGRANTMTGFQHTGEPT